MKGLILLTIFAIIVSLTYSRPSHKTEPSEMSLDNNLEVEHSNIYRIEKKIDNVKEDYREMKGVADSCSFSQCWNACQDLGHSGGYCNGNSCICINELF